MHVIVVGAGIIGHACAYALARRGCRVRLIDMRGPGLGATRASAGILAPYIEGKIEGVLALGVAGLAAYDEFVWQVRRDGGADVEFRRCGTLQAARSDAEAEALRAAAGTLSAGGVEHELVGGQEARLLEPALDASIAAALIVPEHGYVRVGELMTALAAAAGRLGVEYERGRVDTIEPAQASVRLRVDGRVHDADHVVIAAGTWSGALGSLPVPVKPIRGQLVELRCATRPVTRVVWGEGCYVVPWCSGAVLVGATSEDAGFDETAVAGATRRLIDAGRELVPSLHEASVADVRVGLRPATPDELPIVGRSSTMPRVIWATGHYRHGVLLAPLTAGLIAALVVDNRADPLLDLTAPVRFGL